MPRALLLILALAGPLAAAVPVVGPPTPVADTSGLASQADLATVSAAVPKPATAAPGAEMVGGATGSGTQYALANHSHPRISRTGSCALSAAGVCTLTWTSSFPAGVSPVMLGDPSAINSGAAQPINCNVTGAPTTTGVPVKCWIAQSSTLSLSLVTAGVNVLPFNATSLAGVTVTGSAIPASQ